MIIQGRVENGVVVLTQPVRLPEGQPVLVLASPESRPLSHSILDIAPVSVGRILEGPPADLLEEMLEGHS